MTSQIVSLAKHFAEANIDPTIVQPDLGAVIREHNDLKEQGVTGAELDEKLEQFLATPKFKQAQAAQRLMNGF